METPRDVYPFPLFEEILFGDLSTYRNSIMKWGRFVTPLDIIRRAFVIDSGALKVEISNCIIEGRIGLSILCKESIFLNTKEQSIVS